MYELKTDISIPGSYIPAGTQRTREKWQAQFKSLDWDIEWRDWFIDLEEQQPTQINTKIAIIVRQVFDKKGLHSITYRLAAIEVAKICLTELRDE